MNNIKHRLSSGKEIIKKAIQQYYEKGHCACQHPRFVQITSINCKNYNEVFKCIETSLLINFAKPHFNTRKKKTNLNHHQDSFNEIWTCKHCGTEFLYGWADLSIALDREHLTLISLNTQQHGKAIKTPIPLYIGLHGYSYPSKDAIQSVDYMTFSDYILEVSN